MYYYPQTNTAAGFALKGRPVSSLEEVRAAQIDFDGSLFVFPDIAHNRIYTKQVQLDGNASLRMYELAEIPTTVNATDMRNYVTREELKEILREVGIPSTQPDKPTETATAAFNF